jgi:predicted nucleic acid-binding protein
MREMGISEALTADHHFAQAGFVSLMNQPRHPR